MSAAPASVVVVGGAGFIGSHVVELLMAGGHHTMVIDDMSHPCGVDLPAGVEVVVADAGAPQAAAALQRFQPGALLHLAARGGVNIALSDPAGHIRRVLASSVGCFHAAVGAGCRTLVIASSGGAVYGDAERLPADEGMVPAPRSAYGAGKLCEETYLWTYRRQGVRTVALRYGNVYGPRQDGTGEAGVVAISCTRLAAGQAPVVYGSGEQTRDFVYVADVVAATVASLGADVAGPINVGTGIETSVSRVVAVLAAAYPGAPAPEQRPARAGEVARGALANARAAAWLGWRPAVPLEKGLRDTADYFGAPPPAAAGAPTSSSKGVH